jgi:predicted acylesterase/phospholipase RssA
MINLTQSQSPRCHHKQSLVAASCCQQGYDLVLGAGGVKGYAEIGVLRVLQRHNIPIGKVRGVSVGAGNAALVTNHWTPDEMLDLYESERENLFDATACQHIYAEALKAWGELFAGRGYDPIIQFNTQILGRLKETAEFWQRAFALPDGMQFHKSPTFVSLEKLWEHVCRKYGLVPNEHLEIVAFSMNEAKPVFFKGTNYPLHTAVAASGSLPPVFMPVKHDGHLLGDGALWHYNPVDDLKEPAIVVRLGRAKQWPREPISLMDAIFLWHELHMPFAAATQHVDEDKHIVIDIPCDDVAGLAFGTSYDRRMGLVKLGEDVAERIIAQEVKRGRIILDQ